METPTLPESAGNCGQSSDSADNLRTQIEVGANCVAVIKVPLPVKALGEIIDQMHITYGPILHFSAQPTGWLQFIKP